MGIVNKKSHQGKTTIVATAKALAETRVAHRHRRGSPQAQQQADQKPAAQPPAAPCLMFRDMRLMSRDPTPKNWTETAVACNPTGKMSAPWREPSEAHTLYPGDLLISKCTIWDARSETEVALASKLKHSVVKGCCQYLGKVVAPPQSA